MTGFFEAHKNRLFRTYACEIQFNNRVVGATPANPKLIEGWLRKKMGISDDTEIRQLTIKTLIDLGMVSREDAENLDQTYENVASAAEAIAKNSHTSMFRRDDIGLYLESRIVKANLRESVNSAFPWGHPEKKLKQTKKSAKSFFVERVFVSPSSEHIHLLVPDGQGGYTPTQEPSGIDLFVGHVTGAQGPRSTLGYYEYVDAARMRFDVMVFRDEITDDQWPEIWVLSEELGLGAMRSQGFGRFLVTDWRPKESTLKTEEINTMLDATEPRGDGE